MTGSRKKVRSAALTGAVRTAGILGAAAGVVAAGVAAGVAAERAVVRRSKRVPDRYADEVFGQLPHNHSTMLEMADGTDIHVEVVEPSGPAAPAEVTRPEWEATATGRPSVVFVHGFCLDMGTFHFQRRVLTERGDFRMVFYDQPGHGRSGRLKSGEYQLRRLGETLRAVVDATVPPDEPLVLVGHSMGGMTIMAFAELYPELFGERVVGTVLMATSGGLLDEAKVGLPAILGRTGTPLIFMLGNATRLTGGVLDKVRQASSNLAWLLTRRYGFGTERPSPALVSYVEDMNSHTSTDTVARYLRTLYLHSRYPALEALRRTPALVIVGEKDMIIPVTHSDEILRRLPDAQLVKIPDSGHVVMLEHADEVNEVLIDFLERLTA